MAGLLLLTCTLLAVWRPAVSTGSESMVSAGTDVALNCMEGCHSGEVWIWMPRYPNCAKMNSSHKVIFESSSHANSVVQQHFFGRLKREKNNCSLLLEKAQVNDSGTFICNANNQSQQVILDISHGCSGVDTPADGTDKLGQRMKLSCCSEDGSEQKKTKREMHSKITWKHNGQVPKGSLINKRLRDVVLIDSLTAEHRGAWTCLNNKDGLVVIELCLEVQDDEHGAAQPTSRQAGGEHSSTGRHNRRWTTEDRIENKTEVRLESGPDKPVQTMVVWGIAGVLAALLIILLMVGVYCCTKGRNQGTTKSENMSTKMETGKPAGGSAGAPIDAVDHAQSGPGGPRMEEPRKEMEDTGEVQYCHLNFNMEERRTDPPRAPETTLYSEVARKY